MRKIIIIIVVMIALAVQVLATGFSPSSLIFNLEQNKQQCQLVTITSDSETITVSDKWAENKDIEWKVSLFNENADYHDISINYNNELSSDERQVEVCLSGNKIGEYHGVLLLREEQQGNSVVQMGIWLKVIITQPQTSQTNNNPAESSNGGGSGGGGGGSSGSNTLSTKTNITNTINNENSENKKENNIINETSEDENSKSTAGITGAVIGGNGKLKIIIIIILAIVVIADLLIYYKRKKQ